MDKRNLIGFCKSSAASQAGFRRASLQSTPLGPSDSRPSSSRADLSQIGCVFPKLHKKRHIDISLLCTMVCSPEPAPFVTDGHSGWKFHIALTSRSGID